MTLRVGIAAQGRTAKVTVLILSGLQPVIIPYFYLQGLSGKKRSHIINLYADVHSKGLTVLSFYYDFVWRPSYTASYGRTSLSNLVTSRCESMTGSIGGYDKFIPL
jgi:hypothetical protein